MAKKLKKKKVKRLINDLVKMIELADYSEFEDASVGLAEYHRGTAHGLRAALSLISDKDVPQYAIIRRGEVRPRYNFVPYEEPSLEPELALEWAD